MLLLKLIIVPTFLALLSQAARIWGPSIAGLLSGFPVVAGPILVFFAIEQGAAFAAQAAQGALLAVIATIVFALVFVRSTKRFGWLAAGLLGFAAWACTALVISLVPNNLWISAIVTLSVVTFSPRLLPVTRPSNTKVASLPKSELAARMAAGAILVLGVTAAAQGLGTRWAGLFAMFPVLTSVLGIFSFRANGKEDGPMYVAQLFRGLFRGFYAFCTFCVCLAISLTVTTPFLAFLGSVMAALAVQGLVYWYLRKQSIE